MKIFGYTIAEIARDADGNSLRRTQTPPGILHLATEKIQLQFALELLGLFSYDDRGRKDKFTREYRDWMALARDRFTLTWTKQKLQKGREWALGCGLLIEEGDDWRIDISVIPDCALEQRDRTPKAAPTPKVDKELKRHEETPAQPALQASASEPFNPQATEERETVTVDAVQVTETPKAANAPLDLIPGNTCTSQQAMEIRLRLASTGKGSGVRPEHIQRDPNRYIALINDHTVTTEGDPF